jgi:hypothetical protein
MCFYFPCFDTFFKKKDIVGDDDGSTSSMPDLHESHFSARTIGVNISPGQDPHSFDTLVYTDGGGGDNVVVDLLSCDDDDDDDDGDEEEEGFFFNKPRPPWNRYYDMLKREKERGLDMEFFDLYVLNQNKVEDRRHRILDKYDSDDEMDDRDDLNDSEFIDVNADVVLFGRQAPAPVFGAVRFPIVEFDDSVPAVFRSDDDRVYLAPNDDGPVAGCDEESVSDEILLVDVLYPNPIRDPLSYFDPAVLRVSKKAMQQQVDQKKVELRNLGMEVPDDQTIFEGLDVSSSFRLINEALEKDPATSKKNHHRN